MTLPDKDCMVAIRWRPDGPWVPALYSNDIKMFDVTGYQSAFGPSEIHSYRILVFADEVDLLRVQICVADVAFNGLNERYNALKADVANHIQEAYKEGFDNCDKSWYDDLTPEQVRDQWSTSHAKRVAEGGV